MKKVISLVLFGILILSGIGAGTYLEKIERKSELKKYSDSILFSEPIIKENEYLFINLKESNSNLQTTGEPILPTVIKKYVFPFGTKIKDIQVTFSEINEYSLSKKIAPAPSPVTMINGVETMIEKDKENEAVYTSNKLYPGEQYTFSFHAGLEGKDHVVILNLRCFPIQYLPIENLMYSAGRLNIDVTYELPEKPVVFSDEYDMIIIAPEAFSADLQPLIDHKNSYGIQTTLKTTETIYNEYSGRDQPEKIKYFIKDAIENWGISYVLLVGGKKSLLFGNWGTEGPRMPNDELWHVPVRYNTLEDMVYHETGCLTDLYFADVYKFEGNEIVFDDWDSDGNGFFAEWTLDAKDIIDYYPDVYVGRLACRNKFEVQIMVDKIITYEAEGCDPSWFKKIVSVGGDSFDDSPPLGDDYFEGEERGRYAADLLNGFTLVRVWASQRDTGLPVPKPADIIGAINDGCGFIYFAGHANPSNFMTYWYHEWGNYDDYPGSFNIYSMLALNNGEQLPICVVGACHNSEFNVSFFNFLYSPLEYYPTPECWSWMFTRKIGGGAIATIGYTGYEWVATYGWDDDDIPDCTQFFSGYIDSRFFHAYGIDGVDILGEAWGQAISEYRDRFHGGNRWDGKTPQQWLLLGDPSLKIGGYP